MKLYYNTTLEKLKNKNNFLVHLDSFNGVIRNKDGEEAGNISCKIMKKLIDSNKLFYIGKGNGILSHEKYYILPSLIVINKGNLYTSCEKIKINLL